MKVMDRVKSTIINTKKSVERFPITIIVSFALAILLIYQNEISATLVQEARDNLTRLVMVVGLGIPLSLCIGLLRERFVRVNKFIGYILGGLFLVVYYLYLLKDFQMVAMTRYMGTMVFLIIVFFYALKINHDENYEKYVIKVFSGAFLTALYSVVLYLGLAAILLTIDNLFDVNIDGEIYYYMFLIVVFVFAASLFLSKIPEKDDDYKNYEYSKSLKVLLVYIVIPLISVYTLILYAYFVKILVTWQWPKGLVSHLVLWYSVISVGVIFLITPVLEENKVAKTFKIWFPKFILPILVMMFMSIWQRIDQYGITENRYYIILLGIWVLGIMLYFSFKKPLKNILIPISLSLVVLLSVYGPVSSYSMSKSSQNNRLIRILEANKMLVDGNIKSNQFVDKDAQTEINNIITYFISTHSLDDIKVLPANYEVVDSKELFGFEYLPYNPYEVNQDYFSYYVDHYQKPIDIGGFDYYINMSSWNEQLINIDNLAVKYNRSSHTLLINEGDINLITVDINELASKIHSDNGGIPLSKDMMDLDKMTVNLANDNVKIRILFTNINGRYNINNEGINLENTEFLLLIDKK